MGLRHSRRVRKLSTLLKESNPKSMGGHRKRYGMLVLALSIFSQIGNSLVHDGINNVSHCYQARVLEYEDYLDRSFDGTNSKTSTLAQIYLSSQSNNECYNVKEMFKEPDRDLFMKAMEKELSTMFKE